jgi:hypothetical protein
MFISDLSAVLTIFSISSAHCYSCHTTAMPLWRKDDEGKMVCNACVLISYIRSYITHTPFVKLRSLLKAPRFCSPNQHEIRYHSQTLPLQCTCPMYLSGPSVFRRPPTASTLQGHPDTVPEISLRGAEPGADTSTVPQQELRPSSSVPSLTR